MLPELVTTIPGPESRRLATELRRHESRNVTHMSAQWPIFWERAAGVNVWDTDGNRFLDLTSAFAVAGLGHGRREIVDAMTRQAEALLHGMGDVHPTRLKVELCARLSALTFERWGAGPAKTILSNSGFEAVESAMKTAVLATGRPGVLAFEGGYHGLGYGALLPTGFRKFREPFARQLGQVATWLPYPRSADDLADLQSRLREVSPQLVGAVIVEPVQGRGGVVIPPPGFLTMLREWCDPRGALLVFDEIFTGFHRTGTLFACEHEQVVPDLICLGKAMSGGFPISACVGKAAVMDCWPESAGEALHTSTFLGHPVGCAMALESLRLHRTEEIREQACRVGRSLQKHAGTLHLPNVREVRGRGAMWGVELTDGALAGHVVLELLKRGILLLPGGVGGNVLTLTPPFVITEEELAFALGEIAKALASPWHGGRR